MKRFLLFCTAILFLGSARSQDLIAIEYFVDVDPGYGNGVMITSAPTGDLDLAFDLNLSNVSNGVHMLGIRALNNNGVWGNTSVKLLYVDAPNQHGIVKMEYFFDNDPGYGNGHSVGIIPGSEVSVGFELQVSNLLPGLHNLFIRSANEAGIWGNTSRKLFYYDPATQSDIVQIEYFIDSDPGFGQGQQVGITPGMMVSQAFEINTTNLQPGVHVMYVRAKNEGGVWSVVSAKTFLYERSSMLPDIVQMEYFYDTDPGFGLGYPIPLQPSTQIQNAFTLDISPLSAGNHLVYFRVKDSGGHWSLVSHYPINIFDTKFFVEGLLNPLTGLNSKVRDGGGAVFPGAISDTLSLVFRDEASPYAPAFVHKGVQLLENGSCKTAYTGFPVGNYFIDIVHRNSINTWSSVPVTLSESPYTYDFTAEASRAWGNNLKPLGVGVYGLYSGDVNQDGAINTSDVDLISNSAATFASDYQPEDVNGDGAVDALDLIVTDNNAASSVSADRP